MKARKLTAPEASRPVAIRGFLLALLGFALLAAGHAQAHDLRGTALYLDIGARVVGVELHLPRARLGPSEAGPTLTQLTTFLRQHLRAITQDGTLLQLELSEHEIKPTADAAEIVAHGRLEPVRPAAARRFELHYLPIEQRATTYDLYVFVRRDVRAGLLGDAPQLLGALTSEHRTLTVDRTSGSALRGLVATFKLGLHHIAEGTDHLLFLLMLLLPAPLVASQRRWSGPRDVRASAWAIFKLVTAFTLGHSLTLMAAALGGASLPSGPVEVLIAASIAVSAVHAIWPVFAGRELLIAAGFGLVHGLAFAAVLRELQFDPQSLFLALLGFNLGIEAMQLAVVLSIMPWLVLASRSPGYAWLRRAGGAFGALAAIGWIAQRAWGIDSGIPGLVDGIAARAPWLVGAIALLALLLYASALRAEHDKAGGERSS